ncbi:hypothetical protein [Rhodophyticola sp.]|uniref:hypothetical protein n=1 Tax=Rhodophyticola sp. TaxID=2680032 RepID=UPI003D27E75B
MFKEQIPTKLRSLRARLRCRRSAYCSQMFVTENKELFGPRWIINFPTKTHWRVKTKIEWVEDGLKDLVRDNS